MPVDTIYDNDIDFEEEDRPWWEMSECLVEGHYGRAVPNVFCENFSTELEEQGLAEDRDAILNDDIDDPKDGGEVWVRAWENILSHFEYSEDTYLYTSVDGDIYAVPRDIIIDD